MTAIVGLVEKGRVWLGADSAAVGTSDLTLRRSSKVFALGPYVLGYTTSFRMGQFLQHAFTPPPPPKRRGALERFLVVEWVDALRSTLKVGGWLTTRENQELGDVFLVGVAGRLFYVGGDFQIGEPSCGYEAVGAGFEVARGALFASRSLPGRRRVQMALHAAERFSACVRGPFRTLCSRPAP